MAKKRTKKLRGGKRLKEQKALSAPGDVLVGGGTIGKFAPLPRLAANHNEIVLHE